MGKLHSRLGAGVKERKASVSEDTHQGHEIVSKDDKIDFFQLSEILGVLR